MINYSIIIPFRDCTESLRKACASIPLREDIQVIVVDNAQSPVGYEVVNDFGYPNIEYYISSPTKGAGCARNEGLKHAHGEFLIFLDADDYFTPDAFVFFDAELYTDYDIVYFNATSIRLKTGESSSRHLVIDKYIKNYQATGNEDFLRYHFVNPVCKMIRRDLVLTHKIVFQEVRVSNDIMFSTKIGHYANKVKGVDKVVYVITEGEKNDTLTKSKSKENQFTRFMVAIDHYHFVESIGRMDLSFRIYSFIIYAFINFGLREGFRWIKCAIDNNVTLVSTKKCGRLL